MKIQIYWKKNLTQELLDKVNLSLEELWLVDFIKVQETQNNDLKNKLNIQKEPALIIEEKSIDFCDIIFEWINPPEEEIKAMLISIVGWDSADGWCSSGSCGSCPSESSCGI